MCCLHKLGQFIAREIFVFDKGYVAQNVISGKERDAMCFASRLEWFIADSVISPSVPAHELKRSKRYTEIVSILNGNIDKSLKLQDVAELCNMSVPTLKKTFAKYSDGGVMNYFSGLKMKKAVAMLRRGTSVKETAYSLGFSDVNYFSSSFSKIIGKPPSCFKA